MGLLSFLFGSSTPQQQPQPKGLLGAAGADMNYRQAYLDYAEKVQTAGGQPMNYNDWVKMQQNMATNIQTNNVTPLPQK